MGVKLEAHKMKEIVSPCGFSTYWCQNPFLHLIIQGKGQVALLSSCVNSGLLQFIARCQQKIVFPQLRARCCIFLLSFFLQLVKLDNVLFAAYLIG